MFFASSSSPGGGSKARTGDSRIALLCLLWPEFQAKLLDISTHIPIPHTGNCFTECFGTPRGEVLVPSIEFSGLQGSLATGRGWGWGRKKT